MSGESNRPVFDKYALFKRKYLDTGVIIPKKELTNVRTFIEGAWGKEQPGYESYLLAKEGDFSQFENVHPLCRAFLASVYMHNVLSDERGEHLFAPERYQAEVTAILQAEKKNPLFRLGCSQLSKSNVADVESYNFRYRLEGEKDPKSRSGGVLQANQLYQRYDDRMTDMLMEDTLNPLTEEQIKNVRALAGNEGKADAMIRENIEKQTQLAKLMFLAHIGKTTVKTSTPEGALISEDVLERSVSSMMSHCSRAGFVFAPGEPEEVSEMMDAVLGKSTGAAAGVYGRFAATHSTENGPDIAHYREKKGACLRKQYGMDVAIGGLGNTGVEVLKGKMPQMPRLTGLLRNSEEVVERVPADKKPEILKNDGTCGHMYMHVNKGEKGTTSSLLIGFESDAPKKTNQQGHKHTASATPEYMSSFLGQRTDEMGDKYGGRTVDCTMFAPNDLKNMVESFASHYRGLMYDALDKQNEAARQRIQGVNQMLAGKIMDIPQLEMCFNKVGLSAENAKTFTQEIAYAKHKEYTAPQYAAANETAPIQEVKKPGFRTYIKWAFGSKTAREKIRLFKEAGDRKTRSIKLTFADLNREEAARTQTKASAAKAAAKAKMAQEKKTPVMNPKGKKPMGK